MRKGHPVLGCCGLDCGLCPAYHIDGPSRCPGCGGKDFLEKHPSCSILTCCVKRNGLEVCAQCTDYPCEQFRDADRGPDYKTTAKRILTNQEYIRVQGLDAFLTRQAERKAILRELLSNFNDGRKKTLYCLAATLLPLDKLQGALSEARRHVEKSGETDQKENARIMKEILESLAVNENESLRMRKQKTP